MSCPVAVSRRGIVRWLRPLWGCPAEGDPTATPAHSYRLAETWTHLSLPRLFDDVERTEPERWSFAVVALEPSGRVTLPTAMRARLQESAVVCASTTAEVVVLSTTGAGRRVPIDRRGRVVVPCWLRDATGPSGALVIGACRGDGSDGVVALAPARLLTGWADALVGERS